MEKVLCALDGTDRSFETVRYIASVPMAKELGVVLFSVFDEIPEAYWDLGSQANVASRVKAIQAWSISRKNELLDQLEKGKAYLLEHGFPEQNIRTILKNRAKGISRDIIEEAQKGYTAVLAGRRGVARIQEILLGSVSSRLLQKLTNMALCLVGKDSAPLVNVLLAVDGSQNSAKAVDFTGWLCKGFKGEICLIHVIRAKEKEVIEEIEPTIRGFLEESQKKLMEKGIAQDQISTRVIYGAESRALTIIEVARKENYSTIVVGRRGLSAIQDFFMGRVSNKVVQLAKGLTVWVVS